MIKGRVVIISLTWHRLLDGLKFKLIEIGLSRDINPFLVWWMGKLDGSKSKGNSFWLFITLETNFILTMIVNCGLKVLLWEVGRVLEELELKPTQPPTLVGLGLGLGLSLATTLLLRSRLI